MNELTLSPKLKESYDGQYGESTRLWRDISAKTKALNIIELLKGQQFKNVLEVGSGDGSILQWLEKFEFSRDVYSLEISKSGINEIKSKNLEFLKEVKLFDGYHIPYSDNQFDLVICAHVLEHVEFPRALIREIQRVSRFQILEVPIDFSFHVDRKVLHFLSYGHINIYYPALFKFFIKSEAFRIIKEKFGFYSIESLKMTYKGRPVKLLITILKKSVIKVIPFLKKIKPDTYTVLCEKTDEQLKIFQS